MILFKMPYEMQYLIEYKSFLTEQSKIPFQESHDVKD